MKKEPTINLNGTFYSAGKLISTDNRAFLYGDSIFETILVEDKVLLWEKHYARLLKAAAALGMTWTPMHTEDHLRYEVQKTLNENRCVRGRVRLTFFRSDGGRYKPENDLCNFLIQVESRTEPAYTFPEKGLTCNVYTEILKPFNLFSPFKTGNSLLYVMAARKAAKESLDEILLLNDKSHLCESSTGNIFLVKDGAISTPSIDEGCIDGIMRNHIIGLLKKEGIVVQERAIELKEKDSADEIWISNCSRGINWVAECGSTKYKAEMAKKVNLLLLQNI